MSWWGADAGRADDGPLPSADDGCEHDWIEQGRLIGLSATLLK